MLDFNHWVSATQSRIEFALGSHMPAANIVPMRLHAAMRYAALGGGKRVRALLAYAAAEFCGAAIETVDLPAAAVELIHAFSLVHDDMPCMDDDDLRRGKPSTHKQYDDATALLVGDALQSLAFQLIVQNHLSAPQLVQMTQILAIATGSRGMAGGQAIDFDSTGLTLSHAELEHMHIHKTGALIRASALLGAHCANNQDDAKIKAVDHFAQAIGLAFQVVDDILDAEADSATLGKTAGKDALQAKSTYVTILGLSRAKQLAEECHANAMQALAPYGNQAIKLQQLADFILQRKF
jgi:farnesyl diphosphate synthase